MATEKNKNQLKSKIADLEKEVSELRSRLSVSNSSISTESQSIAGVQTLMLRYEAESNRIVQINTPFAKYLRVSKDDLLGKELTILKGPLQADIYRAISDPENSGDELRRFTDAGGSVFEMVSTSHDGFVDIVMRDVTETQKFRNYVNRYFGLDLETLSDDDKRTLSFPERRFITISFTDLRGFTKFTEGNSPEKVRDAINAYFDEVIEAAEENGVFPNQIVGDEIMVLYGAPKHYQDHPLRAIKTACEHIERVTRLRKDYERIGKEVPHCGVGINSGDVIVGDMGSSVRDRKTYTALGTAVNLAARLCGSAEPGQIILSEMTLKAVLSTLPDGWESEERFETDASGIFEAEGKPKGKIEDVVPLPSNLEGKSIVIGPGVKGGKQEPEFTFTYLYQVKAKGIASALPVLTVDRNSQESLDSSVLSDTTQQRDEGEMILGRYRLVSHIGTGGMGTVWKARDEYANIVAIKMLKAGIDASKAQIDRFRREAKVMHKLSHRNICRINEMREADGRIYLAMQFVDGISLEQLIHHQDTSETFTLSSIQSVGPNTNHSDFSNIIDTVRSTASQNIQDLSELDDEVDSSEKTKPVARANSTNLMTQQQVFSIISSVCDAVQFAHERGVLHRDLKPGNIMIGRDGEPTVMDFGLAKLTQRNEEEQRSLSLSMEGQVMGTIEYMAPEQALSSKEVTEQADIYSIGAIFYHLITGAKPFNASGNILSDAKALQDHEPVKPRKHNRYIDSDLETIVLKALQSDPNQRYRSAQALQQDIERFQNGDPISARKPTIAYRVAKKVSKNKVPYALGALAVLVASIFVLFLILENHKNYGNWNNILSVDFNESKIDTDQFVGYNSKGEEVSELWQPNPDGKGVRLISNQWVWLSKITNRGDAKVELQMRYHGEPEGFQICINGNRSETNIATAESLPNWDHNPTGYACRYGIWGGSLGVITANQKPEAGDSNKLIPAIAPANRDFLLTFERKEGVLSLFVDQNEIHRETVLVPLRGVRFTDIGFRTWSNNLSIESIDVYRFTLPQESSPTVAGDALVEIGETEKALDKYLGIAEDYPTQKPGVHALSKAYQLWVQTYLGNPNRTPEHEAIKQQIIQLLKEHPKNSLQEFSIQQIEAPLQSLDLFSQGKHADALALFPDIKQFDPDSRIALQCLDIGRNATTPQVSQQLLTWVAQTKNVGGLDLRQLNLANIDALAAIPKLAALDIRDNQIASIQSIQGKPLRALYCQNNNIESLAPLQASKNLMELYCENNQISDISVLSDKNLLYEFSASNNKITDLSPLRGKQLSGYFDFSGNQITSIEPLAEVDFNTLYCKNNQISDLSPLANKAELHSLYCSDNPIKDLSPLATLPNLKVLDISNCEVNSIAPLVDHPNLEFLYCKGNSINDLHLLSAKVTVYAE